MKKARRGIISALVLFVLFVLSRQLPSGAVDPWNIFIPKKMASIVFALALIQFSGSLLLEWVGPRVGAIVTGFLGGLISSTATTASLARRSKIDTEKSDPKSEVLIFLSATIAMHIEGIVILLLGTEKIHPSVLILFLGPVVVTGFVIFLNSKKAMDEIYENKNERFELLPVLKLSVFVIAILGVSKFFQNVFGRSGLFVLTFFVSLFEIHGSFIANIQLHDAGAFDVCMLGNLAAVSIAASYCSKLFLVYTIGSRALINQIRKYTLYLSISLGVSWFVFVLLN